MADILLTLIAGVPTWQVSAGGFVNPMTTAGDLIVGGTAGAPGRLAIGSAAQVLTVSAGLPTWSALPAPSFADPLFTGTLAHGAGAGAATSWVKLTPISITGIADNVATKFCRVTIPNGAHAAMIEVHIVASAGAGGSVGAFESSFAIRQMVAVTRVAGENAAAIITGSITNNSAGPVTVVGGTGFTNIMTVSAIAGAVGAPNTVDVQVTLHTTSGATNHSLVGTAEVINSQASGVTIAP